MRFLSRVAALFVGARPAGEKVPDPSAKVGSGKDRISGQREPENSCHHLSATHLERRPESWPVTLRHFGCGRPASATAWLT